MPPISNCLYGVEVFVPVRVLLQGVPQLPEVPAARDGFRDKVKAGVSLCMLPRWQGCLSCCTHTCGCPALYHCGLAMQPAATAGHLLCYCAGPHGGASNAESSKDSLHESFARALRKQRPIPALSHTDVAVCSRTLWLLPSLGQGCWIFSIRRCASRVPQVL